MGSLVAHELALSGKLAPTLLLKSRPRLDAFHNDGSTINVVRPLGSESVTSKVRLNALVGPPVGKDGKSTHIDNLIVATKTYATFSALKPYLSNISKDTNVLILQNGMGMVSALKSQFWSDPHQMPSIYQAITNHGAYKLTPTTIHHVAPGALLIAHVPEGFHDEKEMPDLVQAIIDAPALNASYKSYEDLLFIQMEKLVVNACINPLTAVLDCFNGELLNGKEVVQIMKRVVKECLDCFRAEFPHLEDIPTTSTYLDYDRLLATVLEICKATSENSSSMREDMRHLNTTEIDWINGYIVRLGYKHRIPTPTNKMLTNLVNTKMSIERARENMALEKSIF